MNAQGMRRVLAASLAQSRTAWQELSIDEGTEGQPAPPPLLRAFLLRCPQRIPRAAAAQKPPVHSILISTMSKFP